MIGLEASTFGSAPFFQVAVSCMVPFRVGRLDIENVVCCCATAYTPCYMARGHGLCSAGRGRWWRDRCPYDKWPFWWPTPSSEDALLEVGGYCCGALMT